MNRLKVFLWIGDVKGGFEKRTLGFAEFLSGQGFDVTLGVYKKTNLKFKQKVIPRIFKTNKLHAMNNILVSVFLSYSGYLDQFDICFGRYIRKIKPFVVARNGDLEIMLKNLHNIISKSFNWPIFQFQKKALKCADLVIATSPTAQKFMKKLGVKKVILSSNYIDTKIFKPMNVNQKKHNKLSVIFVGRDDPIKNFNSLKNACIELNIKLIVVGVKGRNQRNIEYHGWIEPKRLAKLYNKADLCVVPSFYESFCTVVLEALACNIPVIVTPNVLGARRLREFVEVTGTSKDEIKQKILYVMKNYGKIKKKTAVGHRVVLKEYNKEYVLKKELNAILYYYGRHRRCGKSI